MHRAIPTFLRDLRLGLTVLLCLLAENHHRGKHNVFQHGLIVEQIELLKNHAHVLPVDIDIDPDIGDIDPVKIDGTGRGILETVQASKKRRFPRPGWSDDDDFFRFVNVGGNILEYRQIPEFLRQVAHLQIGFTPIGAHRGLPRHRHSVCPFFIMILHSAHLPSNDPTSPVSFPECEAVL